MGKIITVTLILTVTASLAHGLTALNTFNQLDKVAIVQGFQPQQPIGLALYDRCTGEWDHE